MTLVYRYIAGALAVLLAVAVVAAVVFRGAAVRADSRADAAEQRASALARSLEASEAARRKEHERAEALAAVADEYERERARAHAQADAVVDALRADTLRLREHWRGCETGRLSEASARAAELDAAEQRRIEGASDLVRLAAEWDAKERALQEVIRKDRGQ